MPRRTAGDTTAGLPGKVRRAPAVRARAVPRATPPRYVGSAWGSRFLYAPKITAGLSRRADFVALTVLAKVQLGLKTGKDKFFFVLIDRGATPSKPQYRMVKGFLDWKGELHKSDLLPAVRNPGELDVGDETLLAVPRKTQFGYLYPAAQLKAELAEYVATAENEDVHKQQLVRDNASATRWFLQSRGVVRPALVLPYNSQYDYYCWDNPHRAVINGRFIGVNPKEDVDADLLLAALNSTFVLAARLAVGTATGNEGAFDVGPPAARVMSVPDVRKMTEENAWALRDVLVEMRKDNRIPPAPDRSGKVSSLRRRLDDAVLSALAVGAGDRAVLLDRLYKQYGRWRAAIEDNERRMRANRRAMTRAGVSRSEGPLRRAARRVWDELSKTTALLPAEGLTALDYIESVDVARDVDIPEQDALFGEGLVPAADGSTIDLGHVSRVRYASLLRQIGVEPPLPIVREPERAQALVDQFEAERIRFRQAADEMAHALVDDEQDAVVSLAERAWYRECRRRLFAAPQVAQEEQGEAVN